MGSPVAGLVLSYYIDGLGMVFDAWPSVLTAAQNSFASKLRSCRDQVALADILELCRQNWQSSEENCWSQALALAVVARGKVMLTKSYRMLACKVD